MEEIDEIIDELRELIVEGVGDVIWEITTQKKDGSTSIRVMLDTENPDAIIGAFEECFNSEHTDKFKLVSIQYDMAYVIVINLK